MLTQQHLKEILRYEPLTGKFYWRRTSSSRFKVGQEAAGSKGGSGKAYICIGLEGQKYLAHRLAWLYMTGAWPQNDIDHINGEKSNNRWLNLRDVTRTVNMQNLRGPTRSNRATKLLGVARIRAKGLKKICWAARIRHEGKKVHLGSFDSPEQAHQAYLVAKRQLHEGCMI